MHSFQSLYGYQFLFFHKISIYLLSKQPTLNPGIYGEEGESNTSAQCRAVSKDWYGSSVWFVGFASLSDDAHKPEWEASHDNSFNPVKCRDSTFTLTIDAWLNPNWTECATYITQQKNRLLWSCSRSSSVGRIRGILQFGERGELWTATVGGKFDFWELKASQSKVWNKSSKFTQAKLGEEQQIRVIHILYFVVAVVWKWTSFSLFLFWR